MNTMTQVISPTIKNGIQVTLPIRFSFATQSAQRGTSNSSWTICPRFWAPVLSLTGLDFTLGFPQWTQRSGRSSFGGFFGSLMAMSTVITKHLFQCLQQQIIIQNGTGIQQNSVLFGPGDDRRIRFTELFQERCRRFDI